MGNSTLLQLLLLMQETARGTKRLPRLFDPLQTTCFNLWQPLVIGCMLLASR